MASKTPILYGFYYSEATYRVRIMLAWKKIDYESHQIDLKSKQQHSEAYHKVNPSMKLPSFITSDGKTLTQSLAIIEYLDEAFPERPCMPKDLYQRALVREIADEIACDIHPIQNSVIANEASGGDPNKATEWSHDHITRGLNGIEAKLRESKKDYLPGKYCVGDNITIADFCLVPQVFNARRFKVDLSRYPTIMGIYEQLSVLPEFQKAAPPKQIYGQL